MLIGRPRLDRDRGAKDAGGIAAPLWSAMRHGLTPQYAAEPVEMYRVGFQLPVPL